jgi:hypothetical protein
MPWLAFTAHTDPDGARGPSGQCWVARGQAVGAAAERGAALPAPVHSEHQPVEAIWPLIRPLVREAVADRSNRLRAIRRIWPGTSDRPVGHRIPLDPAPGIVTANEPTL